LVRACAAIAEPNAVIAARASPSSRGTTVSFTFVGSPQCFALRTSETSRSTFTHEPSTSATGHAFCHSAAPSFA